MDEKFSLKLNGFQTNVASSFSKLRNQAIFNDVTLVSRDKKQINAHRVVLSASSSFFSSILQHNTQTHLMICLDGISSAELENVLDYIYLGEVQISQDDLDRFMEIAEKLELEGLLTFDNKEYEPKSEEKTNDPVSSHGYEVTETKFPTNKSKIVMKTGDFSTIEELDRQIIQHIVRTSDGYECGICNHTAKYSSHIKEHIESHFKGLSFACEFCGNNFSSRGSLRNHVRHCKNKLNKISHSSRSSSHN